MADMVYVNQLIEQHGRIIASKPVYSETIDWYTDYGYEDFNKRMRQGIELTDVQKDHLKNLDEMFDIVQPITMPITTYKGIRVDTYNTDRTSFISTSIYEDPTHEFSGDRCCTVQFTVSPGSKVLFVSKASAFKEEYEALLNRDGKIYITGGDKTGRKDKIFATYFPELSVGIQVVEQAEEALDIKFIAERIQDIILPAELEMFDKETIEENIATVFTEITKGKVATPEMIEFIYNKLTSN